ncbi:unnamed protein product [Ascophyllum nodosum]
MFIGGKLCSFSLPHGILDHIVKVKARETAGVQDNKGRFFEGATYISKTCKDVLHGHSLSFIAAVQSCSLGELKMLDEIGFPNWQHLLLGALSFLSRLRIFVFALCLSIFH